MSYKVKYKYEFPVDEWDRPSGFYTLADVPIAGIKVLERTGELIAKNIEHKMFYVKDDDNLAYDILVNSGSGFTITETTDATSRIHIQQGTGNVGIRTASPSYNRLFGIPMGSSPIKPDG